MRLVVDLHTHSCLSPCGDLSMSPSAIAARAKERGIDILGLTDHNSAMNAPAFRDACECSGILPVFGLEATSVEEAHVLCLFSSVETALEFGAWVSEHLPDIPNDPKRFGDQVWVDLEENILGEVETLLTSATDLSIEELLRRTFELGGLFIPAHIDRPAFSLTSQLGFVPDEPYSAVEIMRLPQPPLPRPYPLITGSDAHYPDGIGTRAFVVETGERSFEGLREAIIENRIALANESVSSDQ